MTEYVMAKRAAQVADEYGFEEEGLGAGEMGEEAGGGFVVDLSDTSEEGNFPVLPRGTYPCTVDSLSFGYSQKSNNPMWTWVFEVESGEFAGRKLYYHTVFNEGGMPRVKRCLARIQGEGDYAKSLLSGSFNPEKVADEGRLLGARCRVKVDIRKYEGKNRNDTKDV